MGMEDRVSTQPEQTFQILDEPGVCVLVLDRDMQVIWANAYASDLLDARKEELLGCDVSRVFDTHLVPLVQGGEGVQRLITAICSGVAVPRLDLPMQSAHGEEEWFTCSSQKMERGPWTGMWVLRMRNITDWKEGSGIRTLHRIFHLIEADDLPLEDLLAEVTRILPPGFRDSGRIGVRIAYGDAVYTHRYQKTPWKATANLQVEGREVGCIEVVCPPDSLPHQKSAFTAEEHHLLQVVADMLGRAIGRSENEKWHRLFARNFQGIAYQATVDLEPVFVGGAVETITGYTTDEFLTGTVRWDAVVHPDDLPRLQEETDSLQAIWGSSVDRIYRILRRDDTVRWIRDLVWNVCDDDGTPVLIQGVIQDVTDRKQKNEGLLSANRQLQVLNQIMGVSASSLSLDELLETSLIKTLDLLDFDVGLTYLVNPERTTALIRSHHMVPGKYLSRNRVIKIHHWPWNFIFIAGQPRYIELRNRPGTVEGGVLTSLEASALACIPILAESVVVGALFVGSRERQGLEGEERRLLEAIGKEIGSGVLRSMLHKRLEAAHRETNLYLDIMTHDIKNAENVASLYCDLLIDTLEGDAAGYARSLRESIRKSTSILQNVATIRRILQELPDLKPVRLGHVVRAELDRIPEVDISFEDSPVEVWADDLLPEIFRNLIGNAARFGGPDVRIAIRVEDRPGDEDAVMVAVEDTGPGIPDEIKETIFHRFQRGGTQGYGEGLGLYIAGMLVERYGGQIWVEDRVEGRPYLGASLRFTLRRVAAGERDG